MSLLSSLPAWVFYVVVGVTFLVAHAVSFRPGEPGSKGRVFKRVLSSVILLVGLVVVQPSEPASLLVGLPAAAVSGFLSGRAAPPVPSKGGGGG